MELFQEDLQVRKMLNRLPMSPGPNQDETAIEIYDKLKNSVKECSTSAEQENEGGKCDIFISSYSRT